MNLFATRMLAFFCYAALVLAPTQALCAIVGQSPPAHIADTVLVVANADNPESVALANYYLNARAIPAQNLLLLHWDANDNADTITDADYEAKIAQPVYAKIATRPRIDYIVLCRNLPTKILNDPATVNIAMFGKIKASVDSALASAGRGAITNPYYEHPQPFSAKSYGMYLVTRLDGWSWSDAFALVDRSLAAAGASGVGQNNGLFFFDRSPYRDKIGYGWWNNMMNAGAQNLATSGFNTQVATAFINPHVPLAGYVSWGSNDTGHYSASVFASLQFLPGALAETAVSTSGSNIRYPGGNQSQCAQLIRDGVTGVKGYVAEPGLQAIAEPDIQMLWYTSGHNLAESFYAASSYIGWQDIVLGDPLCSPYPSGNVPQAYQWYLTH